MPPVAVRILHPEPDPASGPLVRWVADERRDLAEHHRRAFAAAGADDVSIVSGPVDDRSFGGRLRDLISADLPAGLVVLGSGAIPLATVGDRRAFVLAAAGDARVALANNRYSADVVAISRTDTLPAIPDLPGDNALPRWLEEVAGYRVDDLRRRWRLGFDIDGPIDLVMLGVGAEGTGAGDTGPTRDAEVGGAGVGGIKAIDTAAVEEALAAVRAVAADRRAELLIAGRTSAATLVWLEGHAAARVRAWVEERGLRAGSRLAQADDMTGHGPSTSRPSTSRPSTARSARPARMPVSILGTILDRDGPGSLGKHLARFGDAAIVDSRVLLAHRLGADEAAWPGPEDRFASDLLLAERIADPWLRELTVSAAGAPIPVILGGHTLVGPGVRLVVGGPPRGPRWR